MVERRSRWGPYLTCPNWPDCDVTASLHADGRIKGTPADAETRAARIAAHQAFDILWQQADARTDVWKVPEPERTRAIRQVRRAARRREYKWLAKQLGIPVEECHIGFFDIETCRKVEELARKRLLARALP